MDKFLELKTYDDYWWLQYLREKTIFDVDNIKAQKDYLIQSVEELRQEKSNLVKALINTKDNINYIKNNYPNELWTDEDKDRWEQIINDTIENTERILLENK
jgi:hypothetical protein